MGRIWHVCAWSALMMAGVSVAFAEDLTVQDKTFRNVGINHIEPDGITINHSGGICKLSFRDLPSAWQVRFGYDPEKSSLYQDYVQRRAAGRASTPARNKDARGWAEGRRRVVDLEIVEMQRDGVLAKGTYLAPKTAERQYTNEEARIVRCRETRMEDVPLGTVFVMGLSSPLLMRGSRWSGTLYPGNRTKDGHPVYLLSVDDAVTVSQTGALPSKPKLHPFLRGLGDGLTWPLRLMGLSELRFAPSEDRDFRYWCGAIIGGFAYPLILLPFFRRKK